MPAESLISFNFVPELIKETASVWSSLASHRDARAEGQRAAVIAHLTQIVGIIGEFVDASTEADWIEQNVSLCARLKVYAVDFKKVTLGAGLSESQYAALRDSLVNACRSWPAEDAFHQPGRPLSDEARRALRAAAAEIRQFAELLKSGRGADRTAVQSAPSA